MLIQPFALHGYSCIRQQQIVLPYPLSYSYSSAANCLTSSTFLHLFLSSKLSYLIHFLAVIPQQQIVLPHTLFVFCPSAANCLTYPLSCFCPSAANCLTPYPLSCSYSSAANCLTISIVLQLFVRCIWSYLIN